MRPEKEAIVREIKEQLEGSSFTILANFTTMNTVKTAALRAALHEAEAEYHVVPNRLLHVVAKDLSYEGIEAGLKGPTAIVFGSGDVAATAKALSEFIQGNAKVPVIKMGYMDGAVLSADEINVLATLPPLKVMQGVFVGTLAAPMSNLVGVMSQKLASLVYVLKAAADKKNAA
jgi:large subunit ribosomal protein L10